MSFYWLHRSGSSRPKDGKKKAHDATVLKRAEIETLRQGAAKGQKVLFAWDKACIDYPNWARLKRSGIYFITREKSNSALKTLSIDLFDPHDSRNAGIQSDVLVGGATGETLRRVIYRDPRDGQSYTFLTNELTLPAWAIALAYKHRWVIEKVFDELKNKMAETKSWASGETAKRSHAIFACLAHNLSLLMEETIRREAGIEDEVEARRNEIRQRTRTNREGRALAETGDFIQRAVRRATQRTVRFIRWLRVWLYREAPWSEALARIARVWSTNP